MNFLKILEYGVVIKFLIEPFLDISCLLMVNGYTLPCTSHGAVWKRKYKETNEIGQY